MSNHNHFAKTVIASSIVTVLILLGLVYVSKDHALLYLQSTLVDPVFTGETSRIVTQDMLVTSAVEKANPAVVSVLVSQDVPVYEQVFESIEPFGFFGRGFVVPRIEKRGSEEQVVGRGSGFIVTEGGLVVTNRHVIESEGATYSVVSSDGTIYQTDLVAQDDLFDVALLQIRSADKALPHLQFGDSDELRLGNSVIAIGNALGEFQNSVSVGVVSGLSRSIVARGTQGMPEQLDEVIQTDAAINVGNSGGPLLSLDGTIVGINVARSVAGDNIAFAIPGNIVKLIVDSVVATGEIKRPYLGIRYQMLHNALADKRGLAYEYGALIVSGSNNAPAVIPGSPADFAGLQEGDLIISIDGDTLKDVTLAQVLRKKQIDETISLRIVRNDNEETIVVTLEEAP